MAQRIPQKLHDLKNVLRPTDSDDGRPLVWDRATQRYVYLTPPDNVGLWSYGFDAGAPLWLELVPVAGGGTGNQDGTAAATGAEGTAQTGATGTTGAGTTGATGAEGAAQTGAGATTGAGTVSATGAEGTAEPGTGTGTAMAPGTAVATGAEGAAEAGTAAASGTGTVSAAGAEGTAEPGTATGAATSGGTAAATGSEGASGTGTATATGSGTAAATGSEGTSEAGTATASGGGGGATITENFDTAISTTYSINPTYPSNMAATATVQGWTIGSSGTDPATYDVYDSFYGAYIRTTTGGFAGNCLSVAGCRTEDSEANIMGESGFKASKTWTGPFASGTLSIKYKTTGGATKTIKVNGVSVGALTQDNVWNTASIALTSPANITIELECAPSSNVASSIAVDNITYS